MHRVEVTYEAAPLHYAPERPGGHFVVEVPPIAKTVLKSGGIRVTYYRTLSDDELAGELRLLARREEQLAPIPPRIDRRVYGVPYLTPVLATIARLDELIDIDGD